MTAPAAHPLDDRRPVPEEPNAEPLRPEVAAPTPPLWRWVQQQRRYRHHAACELANGSQERMVRRLDASGQSHVADGILRGAMTRSRRAWRQRASTSRDGLAWPNEPRKPSAAELSRWMAWRFSSNPHRRSLARDWLARRGLRAELSRPNPAPLHESTPRGAPS